MELVSIAAIRVPPDRFRPISEKVADMTNSMRRYGQLQPVILKLADDGMYDLVDGHHRLVAAEKLQWDTIGYITTDELDPIVLREIELEVNIQRVDMTWQEREFAVAELHELKIRKDPTWTQRNTARSLGRSQPVIARALQFKQMSKIFPEIKTAKSMNQAQSWMKLKARTVSRVIAIKEEPKYSNIESKIVLGDSVEVIKTIPDESFSMILTDPPFGIGLDKRKVGTEGSASSYEDSEEYYEYILTIADDMYRVINKNGWLIWFLGVSWYERVKTVFREVGFLVDEIPIIWDRSDGRCFTSRPDRYFARGYDIALHCIKGEPEVIIRGRANIIRVPPLGTTERELLVERPVNLYVELIRRLTIKGETIADFFTGSGSVPSAAASLQRDFFAVEKDPLRRAAAIIKVKAHLPRKE